MFTMDSVRQLRRHAAPAPFPWEIGHAAPEDQALGLELELIELNRRRRAIRDPRDAEAIALDTEINAVLDALGTVHPHTSLTA